MKLMGEGYNQIVRLKMVVVNGSMRGQAGIDLTRQEVKQVYSLVGLVALYGMRKPHCWCYWWYWVD